MSFLAESMVGVPADPRDSENGSLVSKGSACQLSKQGAIQLKPSNSPAFGPRLVTPAFDAGAFAFFAVASTLDLVVAGVVSWSELGCTGLKQLMTYLWCSSNVCECLLVCADGV